MSPRKGGTLRKDKLFSRKIPIFPTLWRGDDPTGRLAKWTLKV
jgi:hypothetical protein